MTEKEVENAIKRAIGKLDKERLLDLYNELLDKELRIEDVKWDD